MLYDRWMDWIFRGALVELIEKQKKKQTNKKATIGLAHGKHIQYVGTKRTHLRTSNLRH